MVLCDCGISGCSGRSDASWREGKTRMSQEVDMRSWEGIRCVRNDVPLIKVTLKRVHRPLFSLYISMSVSLSLSNPLSLAPHLYTRLASPRLASPRLASPRLASPRLASPRLASPRLASPRLASPRLASPTQLNSTQLNSTQLNSTTYLISHVVSSPRVINCKACSVARCNMNSAM